MSHGEVTKEDWKNIITIRPGPVLHVWRSGSEFCAVPLTHRAALNIIGSLTAAMQVSDAPKVKPLEWKQYEGDIFCAKTPWGCYFAQWDDEVGAFFSSLELGDHEDPIIIQPQDVASLSEAQDAAQADYETRILSALVQP